VNEKIFRGKDLKEALGNVRREIGEDALILSTRHVRGRLGPFSPALIEVVAAEAQAEAAANQALAAPRAMQAYGGMAATRPPAAKAKEDFNERLRPIEHELRKLRSQLVLLSETRSGPQVSPLCAALERAGMSSEVARDLAELSGVADAPIEAALASLVDQRLPLAGAIGSEGARIIALVGPAGVGKSTTIAKLAANAALVEGKTVAMITIDTHRAGAVEQMRRYANLIGIPLIVAANHAELEEGLRALASYDFVFVDTAGRSQRELEQLAAAADILRAADPRAEMHLTLQGTSSERHMRSVVNAFRRFAVNRLLFTKLDEAVDDAAIVGVALTSSLALSYWTNGQRIPEDIARVKAPDFVERLHKLALPKVLS
jgi:flagellar biosynthesis protein FlhF